MICGTIRVPDVFEERIMGKRSNSSSPPERYQTSIQITEESRLLLFRLVEVMGVSRTDVMEMAVRELAQELLTAEKIKAIRDTPEEVFSA
jgi:hypothetical protein